jgi:hypothetical protein
MRGAEGEIGNRTNPALEIRESKAQIARLRTENGAHSIFISQQAGNHAEK